MVWKNDQVTEIETQEILKLARESLEHEGDYVELGCYKGDTSLMLADVLRGTGRKLWIYDSFEGLPKKTDADESELGRDFCEGALYTTKREIKERFLRAGLALPVIKKAWFRDLTDADMPKKIAFAFLDGDLYESIRDSLKVVENKVVSHGIIVVHDYDNPALPGVARAVDEWLGNNSYQHKCFKSMIVIMI